LFVLAGETRISVKICAIKNYIMTKLFFTSVLFLTTFCHVFGQDAETYYKAGLNKMQSKEFDEAIEQFSDCIKLQPENYYAYFNRGVCKNRLKRYEESILDFDQAVKIDPK
jgi:tetratricopeptide (TPR) repeat protein